MGKEKRRMASFNTEQAKAISAPSNKNILISAGAGSGKTKTLTERVFSLIDKGEVKPSELLVRTFTNNAAHERKERIVARFKKAENDPNLNEKERTRYKKLSDERLSCHVQTFDSFSQYLVSTYSSRLGISPKITIADDVVRETKKQVILDERLTEYYQDRSKKDSLFSLIHSLTRQNDSALRAILLDLDNQRASLTEEEKKRFFLNYEDSFLSDKVLDGFKKEYIRKTKKKIADELKFAFLLSDFYSGFNEDKKLVPVRLANARRKNPGYFTLPYDQLPFKNETEQERYGAYLKLREKEGDDFLSALSSFTKDHEDLFDIKKKERGFERRKQILGGSDPRLVPYYGDVDTDRKNAKEQSKAIHFLLLRLQDLEKRISDYKKTSNVFTFADIGRLSLRLRTDKKYEKAAKEIRNRFTYIRVDEYQDTNDAQELFLSSLRQKKDDGTRSHLFCVGDAKQSIYGFRNSKVELFRKRQKDYLEHPENGEVIARNKNYRSQPRLLHQINAIFEKYRTLDHGGIDYRDESEQLSYDNGVDLYKDKERKNKSFGISRIISIREDYDGAKNSKNCREWEINAIADDIEKKRKEGYQIYDRDRASFRKVRYSDFGILCRTKSSFSSFQEVFQKRNIPLNSISEDALSKVEPVIVVQSLVSLMAYLRGKNPTCQVKHLFASVARSYIRNYSDDTLFPILAYGKSNDKPQGTLDLVLKDPLFSKRKQFIQDNQDNPFSLIFTNRLSSFSIIDKLYTLGNVSVSLAKLESRQARIKNQEERGEGRDGFLSLRQNRNKYKVELLDKSSVRNEDAVNLRTIHGSKGLERNILYRPIYQNKRTKVNQRTKPDYDFSLKYGILLPDYRINPKYNRDGDLLSFPDKDIYPFNYKRYKREDLKKEERDEHVRLFYVALTRAENNLIFVGDGKKDSTDKKKENAQYRRNRLPHIKERNPLLINKERKDALEERKKDLASLSFPISNLKGENQALYDRFKNEVLLPYYSSLYEEQREGIREVLGNQYRNRFLESNPTLDQISALFAFHYLKKDLTTFNQLNDYLDSLTPTRDEDEEEEESDEDQAGGEDKDSASASFEEQRKKRNKDGREAFLRDILDGLKEGDCLKLGRKNIKNKKDRLKRINKAFLLSLVNIRTENNPSNRIEYVTRSHYYLDDEEIPYAIYDSVKDNKCSGKGKQDEFLYPIPGKESGTLNDDDLGFEEKKRIRASKKLTQDERRENRLLDFGTRLHEIRQGINLKNPDLSFLSDKKRKDAINKVFSTPLRQKAKKASSYRQELSYDLSEEEERQGSIDLLFLYEGTYYIVDYKTKEIDDPAYEDQLHVYQHVVEKLFGTKKENIRLFLLSLLRAKEKEIQVE